ncbi:MAG: hypothetical protein AAF960_15535, partial [Bacteroidota bacterium]
MANNTPNSVSSSQQSVAPMHTMYIHKGTGHFGFYTGAPSAIKNPKNHVYYINLDDPKETMHYLKDGDVEKTIYEASLADLRDVAIATGAFPIGLKARQLKLKNAKVYLDRQIRRHLNV